MDKPLTILNQLTPAEFLTEYWQKKPLLIRQAMPDFNGFLTPNELAGLACEESVQSRIVQSIDASWHLKHGPFDDDTFASLPEQDWTLLVQTVNHYLPEAAELLSQFNFIPHARLDDLMISYAPTGGSVGPHMDSYDVFLLQGSGKRRWKLNTKPDLTLIDNLPIRVLKHFESEQEWVLAPGDMLYLPPNVAHYGISEDNDCMTYSIGFRVPKTQEVINAFLEHLQDTITTEGLYADADLQLQQHPAEISNAMVEKVAAMLQNITWDKNNVSDFLGRYITEPRPDVTFEALDLEDAAVISVDDFASQLAQSPLHLDLKSQLLFYQNHFYINGESLSVPDLVADAIRDLADERQLDTTTLSEPQQAAIANTLHASLIAGYVNF